MSLEIFLGSIFYTFFGGRGGDFDSDEAKTRGKRTKEQVQAKNRNKNNTSQSDTPAGRQILGRAPLQVCVTTMDEPAMPQKVFFYSMAMTQEPIDWRYLPYIRPIF